MAGTKLTLDVKALGKEFTSIVGAELVTLLEGAQSDVQQYAAEIGESLARNVAAGRDLMTAELTGQLKALAEVHRIKTNDAAWDVIERISTVAMRTVTSLLTSGIAAGTASLKDAAKV